MNEIELSDKILKDLYDKDKLNGAEIYNIDEIAAKYGIIDLHRVQRIVKNWDSDGFVKEYCDKDGNDAEITSKGIQYVEQKALEKNNSDIIQEEMNLENKNYKYDVVLSLAGEQREYVEQVAKYLKENGIKYFYDKENKAEQWGKNLTEYFGDLYSNKAEFCIMFISKEYKERMWPTHERRSALDRAIRSKKEYILPVKFDDTKIDGLYTSTGYLDAKKTTPKEVVEIFLEKIGRPLKRTHKHKEFSNIPVIKKFEIIPSKVKKGERAIYYWEVENVDQNIIIENHHSKGSGEHFFGKNYKGYYTIDNVQDSITYILSIENNLGKDSRTIELELVDDSEVLLDNKKLNSLISVISNTIKDFENFTFNTKYDFNSNSMIEIIRKISGKDAIKIFIKSVQKILENNIRSGHALKKDSLNKLFTDGILEKVNDLNFLLETIIETIELIKSSDLYKEQNTCLIYEFKKIIRYINENLIKHKEKFIKIEKELLPNAIELCKKQSVDTTELSELRGEFNEINSYFEKINQYYRFASNENGVFISVQPQKDKTELVENTVIDRATKILAKDNMEKLRIFAEHMTEKMSLETATKGLLQTDNIEDYIKKVTGKEVEIIEHKELDKIKNVINQRGYVIISYATWEPAKRYDGLGEGIIHWVMTKEKKVLLNREGLDILNTYHAGFKEEISNHKLS